MPVPLARRGVPLPEPVRTRVERTVAEARPALAGAEALLARGHATTPTAG
jgi:hypothetical protein